MTTGLKRSNQNRTSGRGTRWIAGFAILSAALSVVAASRPEVRAARTISGEAVKVGNGTARAYLTIADGRPVEMGVALTAGALEGLSGPQPGAHPEDLMERYVLPLPAANPTPFKLVEIGWNPMGHEPPGIYDRPHFDFHFYTIGLEERDAMVPSDPEFQKKAERYPDAALIPEGYFAPMPMAVPQMGVHWLHKKTPEINGQPFTTTFLYGSYDGKLIFAEPMITKAFIESKVDYRADISTAQRYEVPGYYPTSYRLNWDAKAGEYHIALTGLVEKR